MNSLFHRSSMPLEVHVYYYRSYLDGEYRAVIHSAQQLFKLPLQVLSPAGMVYVWLQQTKKKNPLLIRPHYYISIWMGHSSSRSTSRFGHISSPFSQPEVPLRTECSAHATPVLRGRPFACGLEWKLTRWAARQPAPPGAPAWNREWYCKLPWTWRLARPVHSTPEPDHLKSRKGETCF